MNYAPGVRFLVALADQQRLHVVSVDDGYDNGFVWPVPIYTC